MIESQSNQKIKLIKSLRKANKRQQEDLIVVEGYKELSLAQEAGLKPLTVFFCAEFMKSGLPLPEFGQENREELSPEVFKKISLRQNPDGFIGLLEPRRLNLNDLSLTDKPLVLVLEGMEKPGNIGAILRTADASGADAVIISDPRTDLYNPNVIRASRGTVFTVPTALSSNEELYKWLKKEEIILVAATPGAEAAYNTLKYPESVAILIGEEHKGLSDWWLTRSDFKVKIPMHGKIDSLNASVTAALLAYEIRRQRG